MSAFTTAARKINNQPSYVSLKLEQEQTLLDPADSQMNNEDETEDSEHEAYENDSQQKQTEEVQGRDLPHDEEHAELSSIEKDMEGENASPELEQHDEEEELMDADAENKAAAEQNLILNAAAAAASTAQQPTLTASMEEDSDSDALPAKDSSADVSYETENNASAMPAVEVRLKQISQEVEKRTNEEQQNNRHISSLSPEFDDIGHQSFLSLTDLIRTLRPNDKQIPPQIDSDYSNAKRVLSTNNKLE